MVLLPPVRAVAASADNSRRRGEVATGELVLAVLTLGRLVEGVVVVVEEESVRGGLRGETLPVCVFLMG